MVFESHTRTPMQHLCMMMRLLMDNSSESLLGLASQRHRDDRLHIAIGNLLDETPKALAGGTTQIAVWKW